MEQTVHFYTKQALIEPDGSGEVLVTINNASIDDIVPQFSAEVILQAVTDHLDLGVITDWVAEKLKENSDYDN